MDFLMVLFINSFIALSHFVWISECGDDFMKWRRDKSKIMTFLIFFMWPTVMFTIIFERIKEDAKR